MCAIEKGQLSPYVLATFEDWRTAALNEHNLTTYRFLGKIQDKSVLENVNKNRNEIGIRSIALRNSLVNIEEETKMNLYLQKDWQKGKIIVSY